MKQTLRLLTIFYNPAVTTPAAICPSVQTASEASLLARIAGCLQQGEVVRIRQTTAELRCLANAQTPDVDPRWVGLTFVPALPVSETAVIQEALPNA